MLNRIKAAAFVCAAFAAQYALADTGTAVMWAANPAGTQTMPDAPPLTLLSSGGYVPLKTSSDKCLLVARRGTQIVAVELSRVSSGGSVIGWKPQTVDMNTVTSKWGYTANASGSTITRQMADQKSSAWTNSHVEAMSGGESESAMTVTMNGKTYSKYSHFKPATAETPQAASDEYICQ
jgi:hypothetical protein